MKKIWNKNKLLIIVSSISIIISIVILIVGKTLLQDKIVLKDFKNNIYSLKYDSTWKLDENSDTTALLSHEDGATIKLEITPLTNEYLYTSLENVVDQISYVIGEDNPNYYLIGKQNITVTKSEYEGYQLLYENGENEVLLTLFKKENNLVAIVYEASYDYFDILLDSAKEIIHQLELIDVEYESTYNLAQLDLKELSLSGNKNIKLTDTVKYEIANKHYLVEYEMPNEFKPYEFDSRSAIYQYDDRDYNITIFTRIENLNIYEQIDDINNDSFDYSVATARKENTLTEETLTQHGEDAYIYHVTYHYTDFNLEYDIVYIIYELDYRRTFIVEIEASNCKLDKSIIDKIKMVSKTKYADYVVRNIQNDKLVNEFKYAYKDEHYNEKYSLITLYTPLEYIELDDGFSNVYETRTFNKDYNEDDMDYDFEVEYSVTKQDVEFNLSLLEGSYYDKKYRKNLGIKNYNDKEFEVYTYNHKKDGQMIYVSALYHKLDSGNYLEIVLESKSKIKTSQIVELTNFNEEIKEMK